MDMIKAEIKKSSTKHPRGHVQEHVLRFMRRGLMAGAFLPGQVMSLRKLAASFGTSPMPVREVLSRLVAANALEETKGGSVRVPRLSPEKLQDLFSVRELLEGSAAERATQNVTHDLVVKLTALNDQLLTAIEERNILACLSSNQKFHLTLYGAAKSDVLMPLIESLWLQFGPTMYISLLIPSMPWNAAAHDDILQALKDKSPEKVREGIVQDIHATCKALLSVAEPDGLELPFANAPELRFGD